ncbi:hypothetical protein ML401_38905 [Bradyrhizobium sp. 62B]|nr:hypothetical protein ML401_38905 [Bradyrhizobium sp. 62B]
MPYAVFKDGEKLSRTFSTKQETLKKADEAGPSTTMRAPCLRTS